MSYLVFYLLLITVTFIVCISRYYQAKPVLMLTTTVTKTSPQSDRASVTVHNGLPRTIRLISRCDNGKSYIYYINPHRTKVITFPALASEASTMELTGYLPNPDIAGEWYSAESFYLTGNENCLLRQSRSFGYMAY